MLLEINHPQEQTQIVSLSDVNGIKLNFSLDDVTLSKNNNDLVFAFGDNKQIVIEDFYEKYSDNESIPNFVVDGTEISGVDLFNALSAEDLLPAAGPETVVRDTHSSEYASSDLLGGINHLNGLDLSQDSYTQEQTLLFSNGSNSDYVSQAQVVNTLNPDFPSESIRPEEPIDPNPTEPEDPVKPIDPSELIKIENKEFFVHEENLENGTNPNPEQLIISGYITITAINDIKSIKVDGQEIFSDGNFIPDKIFIKGGYLEFKSFNEDKLEYDFHLTSNTDKSLVSEVQYLDIVVEDNENNVDNGTITIGIADDKPIVSCSDVNVVTGNISNNFTYGEKISFDSNSFKEHYKDGSLVYGNDDCHVTISAGFVDFSDRNFDENTKITSLKEDGQVYLKDEEGTEFDGLGVHSGLDYNVYFNQGQIQWPYNPYDSSSRYDEINYDYSTNSSEAIIFDLNGKLAYGLTMKLSNFFNGVDRNELTEHVMLVFYNNGEVVDSKILSSTDRDGAFDTEGMFSQFSTGFDKLVITATNNGANSTKSDNSDFTIQDIQFVTQPNDPLIQITGHVESQSGADGYDLDYSSGCNVFFDYDDGDTLETLFGDVTLHVTKGTEGKDGSLVGTYEDGKVAFVSTLDEDGNWNYSQYTDLKLMNGEDFKLSFITKDGDGDIGRVDIPINDSLASSVGIDSYITGNEVADNAAREISTMNG